MIPNGEDTSNSQPSAAPVPSTSTPTVTSGPAGQPYNVGGAGKKMLGAILLGMATLVLQLLGFVFPDFQVIVWPASIACGTLGIWLFGITQFNYASREDVARARQDGPGEPGSDERERWKRVQRQRANWMATILIFVTGLCLSLYIGNHLVVRPSATNAITEPPYQPYWQMYDDKTDQYVTEPGDLLASAAFALGSSVALLAQTNPTLVISLTHPVSVTTQGNGKLSATIEELAWVHEMPVEEVALLYSTYPVLPEQTVMLPSAMPRHWFDWMLWCVIGIAAYLLINLSNEVKAIGDGKIDFLENTIWYWAQFITGPMIAFVLLLFLTRVNFEIVGSNGEPAIAIDLGSLPANLIFIFAFILGYFGRLARKLLEQIAKSIFRSPWMAAYGDFRIIVKDRPYDHVIEAGERVVFATEPNVGIVKWTTEDDIGFFKGDIYRAPESLEQPASVTVTATPTDDGGYAVSQQFLVVPEKYQVQIDGSSTIRPGENRTLRLVSWRNGTSPDSAVQPYWSFVNGGDELVAELTERYGLSTQITLLAESARRELAVNTIYRGYSVVTRFRIMQSTRIGVTSESDPSDAVQ